MLSSPRSVRIKLFLFFLLAQVLFSSCATYVDQNRELIQLYKQERYAKALKKLDDSDLKDSSTNKLLYFLERASILRKMGDYKTSRKILLAADSLIDELSSTSVTETVASFVHNDSAQSYDGELFEKINIHTILAFSFLEEEDLSSARVEAKRINNRLREFTQDLGNENNSYTEDAFALYLSGMIYEAMDEQDDALVDYKKALAIYESNHYRAYFYGNIEKQIAKALHRLALKRRRPELAQELERRYSTLVASKNTKKKGEVIILHEAGHITLKEAKDFVIPVGNQVVRFSYPIIKNKVTSYGRTGVELESGMFIPAENAAHLSSIAHDTLEEKRLRLIAKGLVRVLLKSQINRAVHENLGPLAGFLTNIATAATETADTRSWMFMPDAFYVTRIQLPLGSHQLTVYTDGKAQEPTTIKLKSPTPVLFKNKITPIEMPKSEEAKQN